MMLTLPRKIGVDAPVPAGIAYLYEPIVPAQVIIRNGNNEYTEDVPLPTLRPDWATFVSVQAHITNAINVNLVGANSQDSTVFFSPSLLAVNGIGPGVGQAGEAWPPVIPYFWDVSGTGGLYISVARPTDWMGFPTGNLVWSCTITVLGILYIKSGITPFLYG